MTRASPDLPAAAAPAAPTDEVSPVVRFIALWLKRLAPLIVLGFIVALFSSLAFESFFTFNNLQLLLCQTAVVATASLGMTLIIISGGIDLSVGSMIALVTVVVAMLLERHVPTLVAAAGGIGVGALCGLVSGTIIARGRLLPFIVTLGMLGLLRGIAEKLVPSSTIVAPPTFLNALLDPFDYTKLMFAPGVWITLVLALLVAGLLRYTRFGRHVFAIGSNEQTARLCGVPVERTKILIYVVGGALTGAAGVLQFSSLTGIGDATGSVSYELNIIAAVVIGGASLSGGEGTILGSLVGALIMSVIANGCQKLTRFHIGAPDQLIITGLIILLAAGLDQLRHRWSARVGE